MILPVFLLLSILLVQGRGCDHFMENILFITEGHGEFRKVFPKDYKITHHYNDNLSCGSDSCCMIREAYMLSDAWYQLLVRLWEVNLKYEFIEQLKEKLDNVTQKFLESSDPSIFPSVLSTPEALFNFTSSFFSRWLYQNCPFPSEPCKFPSPPSFTEEGKRSTPAPFTNQGSVEGGKRQKHSGEPQTCLATATHLSVSYIVWCFPLLWTVL
ncbi:hypothetical protein SKAU_G00224680 [Synaphobranchus kaupii]|uniref:Uncharacterized protein n=1 Tax=Synaphobranchus kaupii TaxID=118154 RepID=A0A9Q1IW73_SYNKA|nr:hypothetical protein SKAU_G00224680 [Synaphobranchus kaupii]